MVIKKFYNSRLSVPGGISVCYGLNCVPPQKISSSPDPPYLRLSPYLEVVFADVIKSGSHWTSMGPNPMTDVLPRRGQFGHRHRENAM